MGSRIWLSTGTDSVLRQDRVILNSVMAVTLRYYFTEFDSFGQMVQSLWGPLTSQ